MERISTDSKSVDLHGSGKHGFKDPAPAGIDGTAVDNKWFNAVQEELGNAVEASGQALTPGNAYTQLRGLLRSMDVAASLATLLESNAASVSSSENIRAIAWGLIDSSPHVQATLAVGNAGTILRANDGGLDYTLVTPADSETGDFLACIYIDSTVGFVLCGESGTIQRVASDSYTASELKDGTAIDYHGLAYSPTLQRLVAVGTSGTIDTAEYADLTNYTPRTPGSSYAGDFMAVIWDATRSLFIAVGTGEEIQTSADGITWTRRLNGAGGTLTSVAAGTDAVVACFAASGASNEIRRSLNGTTWASGTTPNSGAGASTRVGGEVICVGDVFLIAERITSNEGIYISADAGATWKLRKHALVRDYIGNTAGRLLFDGRRIHLVDNGGNTYAAGAASLLL